MINEQRVRGIVRDPKHGCPDGCFEITQTSGSGARKDTCLGESGAGDEDSVADVAYEQAAKPNGIGAKDVANKDEKGAEVTTKKLTGHVHVEAVDSEDDDACLNSVWGKRVTADAADSDQEGKSQPTRRAGLQRRRKRRRKRR